MKSTRVALLNAELVDAGGMKKNRHSKAKTIQLLLKYSFLCKNEDLKGGCPNLGHLH